MISLEQEVGKLLCQRKLTLGVVESATGGFLSHLITNIPDSSDYYKGSLVAYSNHFKISLVGVKEGTISKYGAVSSQIVKELAREGKRILDTDICLANPGIAGPGGATSDKPVGLFYIGLSHKDGTYSRKQCFRENRKQNKRLAAEAILLWLKEYLLSLR